MYNSHIAFIYINFLLYVYKYTLVYTYNFSMLINAINPIQFFILIYVARIYSREIISQPIEIILAGSTRINLRKACDVQKIALTKNLHRLRIKYYDLSGKSKDGTIPSFARVSLRGAQCVNSYLEANVPKERWSSNAATFSLSFFTRLLSFSFFSHTRAEGRSRSGETQRVHRNRRGPRVTNASKMDKGYTWPPDGRRRHALLLLSPLFPPINRSLSLSLSFLHRPSLSPHG